MNIKESDIVVATSTAALDDIMALQKDLLLVMRKLRHRHLNWMLCSEIPNLLAITQRAVFGALPITLDRKQQR